MLKKYVEDIALFQGLALLHVICSVLAVIFVFISNELMLLFNYLGASSPLLSFGFSISDFINLSDWVRFLAMLWLVLFPVAEGVCLWLFLKKSYVPLCICITIDAIATAAWVAFCYLCNNSYGAQTYFPDAVISIVYAIALFFLMPRNQKSKGQGTD